MPTGNGPSWLLYIDYMKDILWAVNPFKNESINLKPFWTMVVIDIYTWRIIGFWVHNREMNISQSNSTHYPFV